MAEFTHKDLDTFGKIGWEGGVGAAFDYGVTADDFDNAELKSMWAEYSTVAKQAAELERKIEDFIEESGESLEM